MILALYHGQPAIAELIAAHKRNLDVFESSAFGRLERLRELIDRVPNQVNAVASDGFQPLGLAAFFGREAVAVLLIEQGADVNAPSRNSSRVMPLHSAVAGQHLGIATLLLDHGAEVNATQAGDFRPLDGAAQNGQLEMIELLLERGADAHAHTAQGKTAMDIALDAGKTRAAELIRKHVLSSDAAQHS